MRYRLTKIVLSKNPIQKIVHKYQKCTERIKLTKHTPCRHTHRVVCILAPSWGIPLGTKPTTQRRRLQSRANAREGQCTHLRGQGACERRRESTTVAPKRCTTFVRRAFRSFQQHVPERDILCAIRHSFRGYTTSWRWWLRGVDSPSHGHTSIEGCGFLEYACTYDGGDTFVVMVMVRAEAVAILS